MLWTGSVHRVVRRSSSASSESTQWLVDGRDTGHGVAAEHNQLFIAADRVSVKLLNMHQRTRAQQDETPGTYSAPPCWWISLFRRSNCTTTPLAIGAPC